MKKILRIFPSRTSMMPVDDLTYRGFPSLSALYLSQWDEAHISVCFTWHKEEALKMQKHWKDLFPHKEIKIGGPAFDDPGGEFKPGLYLKKGITITSRGCPFNCDFCLVPKREGKLKEIDIKPGYIIQDNNLLACSWSHIKQVFEMLNDYGRKAIFSGGFDVRLFNSKHVDLLKSLKTFRLWFSYDRPESFTPLVESIGKCQEAGFGGDKINCYILIGYDGDIIEEANRRCQAVFDLGVYPFAMLYRDPENKIEHSREWKELQRYWSIPAIFKMRGFTSQKFMRIRAKKDLTKSKGIV